MLVLFSFPFILSFIKNIFFFSYNRIYSGHRFHSPASPISFLPLLPSIQFHVFFLFLSLVNKEAKKNGKQSCSHQWELLMELQRVKIHCMTKSNWRPPRLPWSIPSHPSAHLMTLLSCWSVSSVYFKSPVAGTLYFPCLTHRISSWWGSLEDMWQATGVVFLDKSRLSLTSGPGPSLPRVSVLLPSFSLIMLITIDIIVLFI